MQATEAIAQLIDQIRGLLQQLEASEYQRTLPEYRGSTLGQHFRHMLEFFQCLEASEASGTVDYAARPRNPIFEQIPAAADENVDCVEVACGLYTRNDHTALDDRVQDLYLPVSFSR